MTSYTLTVTTQQAMAISRACEIVARLGIGQFRDALECLPTVTFCPDGWHDDMDAIGERLSRHMHGNVDGWRSNLGIHHEKVSDESRVLFDLHRVIRHRLAWDGAVERGVIPSIDSPRQWPEMMQVTFDAPSRIGSQPLAKIEQATGEHEQGQQRADAMLKRREA